MFADLFASLLLKLTPVGAFFKPATDLLKRIPPQVWEAIAVLGYALALYATHQRAVHEHDAAIIAANNKQWQAQLDSAVATVTQDDAQIATLSNLLKEKNDEDNARIADDSRTLRLLGPGKAVCPGRAAVPGAARGHDAPAANPDEPGSALPAADLAAVPWPWLVDRSQEHDQLLAEDKAWRTWYGEVLKLWPKEGSGKP